MKPSPVVIGFTRHAAVALAAVAFLCAAVAPPVSAQFGLPHLPGTKKKNAPPPDTSAPPAPPNMPNAPGSASAAPQPAASAPGVPMAADNPIMAAYLLLQQQGAYHTVLNMASNSAQFAKMQSSGMGITSMEMWVKGDVHKNTIRMKIAATDPLGKGMVDDWEATGVVQGGQGAHIMYSPTATPRINAENDASTAQQLAMMDAMFAQSALKNALGGPISWATSGMDAGANAMSHVMAAKMLKKAKETMSWQCQPLDPAVVASARATPDLTDLKPLGDDTINGVAVTKYEFYARTNGKTNGPVRLSVAKGTGLPARLELSDPGTQNSMTIDYDTTTPVNIDLPDCMAKN